MLIELYHPTDSRYLLVDEPPERVTMEDLGSWRYGKALLFAPATPLLVYESPEPGVWVRPASWERYE